MKRDRDMQRPTGLPFRRRVDDSGRIGADAGGQDGVNGVHDVLNYGSCSSLVRHEAYCYIARKAGRDERRLSLDLMPNQSPKGRYGKIAWQKTSGRA
jgi:hypothetical protein